MFQLLESPVYEFKKLVEWHDDIMAHRILEGNTLVDFFSDDIKRAQVQLVANLLFDFKALISEHKREHDIKRYGGPFWRRSFIAPGQTVSCSFHKSNCGYLVTDKIFAN